VSRHAAAAWKLLSTDITFVGLLVHVHGAQVDHQRVLARESLITAVALEDLGGVGKLVGAQHPVAGEGFPARVTLVRSVSLMFVLVSLEVGDGSELLAAVGARMQLIRIAHLIVMVVCMVLQRALGDESLAA